MAQLKMAGGRQAEKFIRYLMRDGARIRAKRIFSDALEEARRKLRGMVAPGELLSVAIRNARPRLAMARRRVGGASYEVPVLVSQKRGLAMAMRTIIVMAHQEKGRAMARRLAKALLMAYRDELND